MAEEVGGGFDGDGVGVEGHEAIKKGIVLLLKFEGTGVVAVVASVDEFDHHLGDDVGGDGDEADGTAGHEGESEGIVAGKDFAGIGEGLSELVDAVDGAASLLDGKNVGAVVGKASGGFGCDGDAGTPGHRVEHDGKLGRIGDGLVVLVESFLRRLVVVGTDLEACGGTHFFGLLGEVDGFGGGVGSGAGDNLHTASIVFDGDANDFEVFVGV